MNKALPPEKAALQRAAAILGGQAALATVLGYDDRRHVWPWFNTNRQFPAEHCPKVERATRAKGELVKCEDLRPDIDWKVFKERKPEEWDDTEPATNGA